MQREEAKVRLCLTSRVSLTCRVRLPEYSPLQIGGRDDAAIYVLGLPAAHKVEAANINFSGCAKRKGVNEGVNVGSSPQYRCVFIQNMSVVPVRQVAWKTMALKVFSVTHFFCV